MSQAEIKQFRKIKKVKINSKLKENEQNMNTLNPVVTVHPIKNISKLPSKSKENNLTKIEIIDISSADEIKDITQSNTRYSKKGNHRKRKHVVGKAKPVLQLICIDSDDEFQLIETKPQLKKIKFNEQTFCSDSDFEHEKKIKPSTSKKKKVLKSSLKKLESETPRTSRKSTKSDAFSTKRKLTNSTNLKQFSAKNQPNSQKYMKQFFTLIPKTTIGYYDTFKESFQANQDKNIPRNVKVEQYLENSPLPLMQNAITASQLIDNKLFNVNGSLLKDNSSNIPSSSPVSSVVRTSKRKAKKKLQFPNDRTENSTKNTPTKIEDAMICDDSINDCILIENEPNNLSDCKLSDKFSNKLKTISKLQNIPSSINKPKTIMKKPRKRIECPEYKIVENTTFAVDAFRFGEINGVTHYFLTHFHGDHYIGLTKKFAKPIYMSEITARLVDTFIRLDKQYVHIIQLNESVFIDSNDMKIEVTAIDANHCPGAIMFGFKFPNSKCCLHTGDFRSSIFMESEPYFWNNEINLIYLDTTYLNKNYAFKDQSDSLNDLEEIIENFRMNNIGKKILYICGSYVIGKEKVWNKIHELTGGFIYVDKNRKKALQAIGDTNILQYLVDDPHMANIHVLPMNEISYLKLWDYLKEFDDDCDLILAIRASGWERNSKPQYRGKINIVGIEYSEHSSYTELRRFIRFLQPQKIISTVPNGSDLSKTSKIPASWYNNRVKPRQQGFQKSITNYIRRKKSVNNSPNIVFDATLSTGPNCSNSETDWMS